MARKAGTPNKATQASRTLFNAVLTENVDFLMDYFREAKRDIAAIDSPKDKAKARTDAIKIFLDMAKFVVPTLQSVDIKDVGTTEKNFVIQLLQMTNEADKISKKNEG